MTDNTYANSNVGGKGIGQAGMLIYLMIMMMILKKSLCDGITASPGEINTLTNGPGIIAENKAVMSASSQLWEL